MSDVEPSHVAETVDSEPEATTPPAAAVSSRIKENFILEIIKAVDIPFVDNKGKSDPYVAAFLSLPTKGEDDIKFLKVGTTVRTRTRFDSTEVVWNCFRNLRTTPPEGAMLTLEIYHQYKDVHKADFLLGKVDVAVEAIPDERPVTIPFVNFKVVPHEVMSLAKGPVVYTLVISVSF